MSCCPICDKKPWNCDCTEGDKLSHELQIEIDELKEVIESHSQSLAQIRNKTIMWRKDSENKSALLQEIHQIANAALEVCEKIMMDYDEQPDSGGNRHYDYISAEAELEAEQTVLDKQKWSDVSTHEIVALRSKAKELGFQKDIVDHIDRLALLRCLFATAENRDSWLRTAKDLERETIESKA